jgi:hypothetical protein
MILLIRVQTCVVTMRNIRSIITVESTGNTSLGFKYSPGKKPVTFHIRQTRRGWLVDYWLIPIKPFVIYVSTRGHWDCTTLQHHCTDFGFASGYTEVLQGGTISMPTDRHVDNLYYPRLENYNNFWLVKTPGIKNPYSRVSLGHITGCN